MDEKYDKIVEQKMSDYCEKIYCFKISKLCAYWNVIKGFVFNRKPLQVNYYHFTKIQKWINIHINDYDAVFCNNIRTAEYVRKNGKTKLIDFVDALSLNYQKALNNRKGLWHYIYKIDSTRCLKYERKLLEEFDKSFIISEVDKAYIMDGYSTKHNLHVIENYVDNEDMQWVEQKEQNTLVFVGTMNYEPNVTAVKYFLTNIFPCLNTEFRDCQFYIVGNNPDSEIKKWHTGTDIIVTGFVQDAKQYIKNSSIVVIPMKSGSGIQNKILEAMSMKGCVVTTSMGVAGMQHINNELIIADSDDIMVKEIIVLLKDKNKRIEVGRNAERYVKKHYSKEVMREKFKKYAIY
jgi:glycosyltransferase involved in cell wall biosynthesis